MTEPEKISPGNSQPPGFFAELKRRKVFRVAAVYAVVGWLIIQVANATFADFGIPVWAYRFVVLMVVLGFPIALVLTWAFELTPDGVKLTKTALEERQGAPVSTRHERKRNWLALGFAAALPTLIFGIFAAVFYVKFRNAENRESTAQTAQFNKSIAVLPLANMSPDPANAFFADGVHEDILSNLSKVRELLVISRTSTLGYKDATKNLREIGQELGVRYLVEGSVRRADDQVRVTVQLIDATNDRHLWAQNYDRRLDDIFAIQSDIAKEIAGQLQAAISPEEVAQIERRPTESQAAYDKFLQARQLIQSTPTRGDEKIALLEEAVALDPRFAEAWAQLAIERAWSWTYDHAGEGDLLYLAEQAFNEAKRLDPNNPYIFYAEATMNIDAGGRREDSIASFRKALAIEPAFPPVLYRMPYELYMVGEFDEAIAQGELVRESDPFNLEQSSGLFGLYLLTEQWEEANRLCQTFLASGQHTLAWRLESARLAYQKTRDRAAYIRAVEDTPGFADDPIRVLQRRLIARDLRAALDGVESVDLPLFVHLDFRDVALRDGLMTIAGDLLPGLLSFALDQDRNAEVTETDAWLLQAKKVREETLYWDNLAISHALMGERDTMESAMATSRSLYAMEDRSFIIPALSRMRIAIAYVVMGNHDAALNELEYASRDKRVHFRSELDQWFVFDRLRGIPRFDALLMER